MTKQQKHHKIDRVGTLSNLTNDQVGAISRAHYNLKAALTRLTPKSNNDIEYSIKELEQVFGWLNIYNNKPRKSMHDQKPHSRKAGGE